LRAHACGLFGLNGAHELLQMLHELGRQLHAELHRTVAQHRHVTAVLRVAHPSVDGGAPVETLAAFKLGLAPPRAHLALEVLNKAR
jgi:hypothetical protein